MTEILTFEQPNREFDANTTAQKPETGLAAKKMEKQETSPNTPLAKALNLTDEQQKALNQIFKECKINPSYRMQFEELLVEIQAGGRNLSFANKLTRQEEVEQFYLAADRISREILKQEDWSLLRIDPKRDEKLFVQAHRIECIVHPLYSLTKGSLADKDDGWRASDWMEAKGNFDVYLQKKLVPVAQRTVDAVKMDPHALPTSYIYLMHVIREVEAMEKAPSADTVRIYVMPRRSLLSPERQATMNALLSRFNNKQENVRVLDSHSDGAGELSEQTLDTLRAAIPFGMPMSFHGGYQ